MKIENIQDFPVIPVRNGLAVGEATLDALKEVGLGLVSFGVNPNDVIEFPESEADVVIKTRQVRANSDAVEYLLAVLKNGKPAWFSIGNLDRRDRHNKPIHPVAETLAVCANHSDRIRECLGKKIVGGERVEFEMPKFVDGVRTEDTEMRAFTILHFVEE